jgi:uncharacterized protein YbbK (DUF523 family)
MTNNRLLLTKTEGVGISACLAGRTCRYDCSHCYIKEIDEILHLGNNILVCPEEDGGLTVPRKVSEIFAGSGEDVLEGKTKVVDIDGKDVTEFFIKGSEKTLEIFRKRKIKTAVFKSYSPACGKGEIYDGTFTGRRRKGNGVTTALLLKNGIKVLNDIEYIEIISSKIY